MSANETSFSDLPYGKFSELRIRNNEPLTYAYLNSHLVKLWSNLESLDTSNTLQKASYTQWGTVKISSLDDIFDSENGNRQSVLTNDIVNRSIEKMRSENSDVYFKKGVLPLSKNYEFSKGEFIVGTGEKIAKRITANPSGVVFTQLEVQPVGYDDKPFYTTRKSTTDAESYIKSPKSSGVINFVEWNSPSGYSEFHVYYHSSGYVICDIGKIDDNQKQMRIVWTQLRRK